MTLKGRKKELYEIIRKATEELQELKGECFYSNDVGLTRKDGEETWRLIITTKWVGVSNKDRSYTIIKGNNLGEVIATTKIMIDNISEVIKKAEKTLEKINEG